MEKTIDCLFIGHNAVDFSEYEKSVRQMGIHSGAYRDLNRNFIRYNDKPYHLAGLINAFNSHETFSGNFQPLRLTEVLNPAIAYLGTYLTRRGFRFDYINSFRDEKDLLAEKLARENCRTIAIITTLYVTVFPLIEIVDFIKKYNTTAKIVVGGPFIRSQALGLSDSDLKALFNSIEDVDVFVNSPQGETALVKIIEAVSQNLPLDGINNIYFKTTGGYTATPAVDENNRLSENTVNWDLFTGRIGEIAGVRTAISCPYSCVFCGYPEHAGPYQQMSIEKIEEELNRLAQVKTLQRIYFIDDTFNVPVKRFKEILRMMIRRRYPVKWNSFFRCQFADDEMVALMKESGCEGVFIGFESGNNQILKNMNKATTVEKYLQGAALLKKYGIPMLGSFIIGFPGETAETVKDTIDFIKQGEIDFYRTSLWYYSHFTPVHRLREQYGLSGSDYEWRHHTMDSPTAGDIIDEIFCTLDTSIWIPLYSFDFDGVFYLLNRGMNMAQIKELIKSFNSGVKEKLTKPNSRETPYNIITQISKNSRIGGSPGIGVNETETAADLVTRYDAEFDY